MVVNSIKNVQSSFLCLPTKISTNHEPALTFSWVCWRMIRVFFGTFWAPLHSHTSRNIGLIKLVFLLSMNLMLVFYVNWRKKTPKRAKNQPIKMFNTCFFMSKVCWYLLCLMLQWFCSKIWWKNIRFGGLDGSGMEVYEEIVSRGAGGCFIWWNNASTLNCQGIQKTGCS